MSKTEIKWLLAGLALVLLGLALFAATMSVFGWDFTKLNTASYRTDTHDVSGEFDKISIFSDITDIGFVPAEDETCRILCYVPEQMQHTAAVENGTLLIQVEDTRNWYEHIGIFTKSPKLTLSLPRDTYTSLFIETATGDVVVPKDFAFETLEIHGTTSDVDCFASVSGGMEISLQTGDIRVNTSKAGRVTLAASSGDIAVNTVTAEHDIDIQTDTGEITLKDVSCGLLFAESNTGEITLTNTVAAGSLFAESSTGDVQLDGSDASQIFIKTDSGDVSGTLLTGKVFLTQTDTGDVSVPKTISGGRCEITTSSGDIAFRTP